MEVFLGRIKKKGGEGKRVILLAKQGKKRERGGNKERCRTVFFFAVCWKERKERRVYRFVRKQREKSNEPEAFAPHNRTGIEGKKGRLITINISQSCGWGGEERKGCLREETPKCFVAVTWGKRGLCPFPFVGARERKRGERGETLLCWSREGKSMDPPYPHHNGGGGGETKKRGRRGSYPVLATEQGEKGKEICAFPSPIGREGGFYGKWSDTLYAESQATLKGGKRG